MRSDPTYTRFVEVGRVVLHNNKLATILDIVDLNRVLIEGPSTGVRRRVARVNELTLTGITIPVRRSSKAKVLKTVFDEAKVVEQFNKSALAKKMARREVRENMSDFDRFKLMVAKKQKNIEVGKALKSLKKK